MSIYSTKIKFAVGIDQKVHKKKKNNSGFIHQKLILPGYVLQFRHIDIHKILQNVHLKLFF